MAWNRQHTKLHKHLRFTFDEAEEMLPILDIQRKNFSNI